MHFEHSWVFLFIPLFLFCERKCPLRLELLFFPHIGRITKSLRSASLMQAFKWMAWGGTILALASPVTTKEFHPSHAMGRDMVLVIDASRSMDEPFSIVQKENKFETVKRVVKSFIEQRKNDRLGLIIFGEYAYVASPVTFDHGVLSAMIPYLEVGMAGERTAIYDAIAMAAKLLKHSEAKSKVAILLTDGRNTAGRIPLQVAEKMLQQYHIKLYTIGVGGMREYDPAILKALAKSTGGTFFSASDPKMLEEVYRKIDTLEPSKVEKEPVVETTYLYSYPLFVAAMSLLAYLFLLNRGEVARG
ncbi:vWA domain-containing protein [Hydrogenimonas urashimensis]|uniref:vWA domain-containing protein n=1 Tax=Hydrogenimonas urashimensis TaxID=2740515 RepID=UPI0019159BAD|nr:VWA domain-containing protein [Hydrogenimonas urashimensis]